MPGHSNWINLAARLRDEQRRAWQENDRILLEDYTREFPALLDNEDEMMGLIVNEMELAKEHGQAVDVEEYVRRFPKFGDRIRRLKDPPSKKLAPAKLVAAEAVNDAKPPPSPPTAPIEGYEVLKVLHKGDVSTIYQAKESATGRLVALKIIEGELDNEAVLRLMIDAKKSVQFKHENCVEVYQVGEHNGRPFMAFELLPGENLEDRLKGKPMAPQEAAELLETLARAIHKGHQRGILHRNLEPGCVLIAEDGTPKITDFGMGRLVEDHGSRHWQQCYLAPEQLSGGDVISPAAVIYALGIILYEMLTGRPPFVVEDAAHVKNQDPVPIQAIRPGVPKVLQTICLKCLEKKPQDRYYSAESLAHDLRRFLENQPIAARSTGRVLRWCRRQPAGAALIVILALAPVAGIVGSIWFSGKIDDELQKTMVAQQELEAAHADLQLDLAQEIATRINTNLRELAIRPQMLADALENRTDWTKENLEALALRAMLHDNRVFGMCIALEPGQFQPEVKDFAPYVYRTTSGLASKDLLPPGYEPIYREWPWYRMAHNRKTGMWSDPYDDQGGGIVPMVTYSAPIHRDGKFAGVATVDLSLDYLKFLGQAANLNRCSEDAYGFVVTHSGIIISFPDEKYQFPNQNSNLNNLATDPGLASLLPRMYKGESGRGKGIDFTTKRPATFLFAPIPAANWIFVAVDPE